MVLEKTLESPLDCKEIQPVHSKGDQPRDFFGRNDAKAETLLLLWPPNVKNRLLGKDPDAGKERRQEEKVQQRTRWLDGITDSMDMEFEQLLGNSEGQGSLACCSPWGHKGSGTTEQLNNSNYFKEFK